MSDANDDPLLGLLTDIAEGVAVLAERIDAMEARAAAQDAAVNEALETIAEIAMRTYYATKPPLPLPDDVIDAAVLDNMIERWPDGIPVNMTASEQEELRGLARLDAEGLRQVIGQMRNRVIQNNADCVRRRLSLKVLNTALEEQLKAEVKSLEPERGGRSR